MERMQRSICLIFGNVFVLLLEQVHVELIHAFRINDVGSLFQAGGRGLLLIFERLRVQGTHKVFISTCGDHSLYSVILLDLPRCHLEVLLHSSCF